MHPVIILGISIARMTPTMIKIIFDADEEGELELCAVPAGCLFEGQKETDRTMQNSL